MILLYYGSSTILQYYDNDGYISFTYGNYKQSVLNHYTVSYRINRSLHISKRHILLRVLIGCTNLFKLFIRNTNSIKMESSSKKRTGEITEGGSPKRKGKGVNEHE